MRTATWKWLSAGRKPTWARRIPKSPPTCWNPLRYGEHKMKDYGQALAGIEPGDGNPHETGAIQKRRGRR